MASHAPERRTVILIGESLYIQEQEMEESMDTLVEKLDAKLRQWKPDTAEQVRQRVAEIMDVADQDALDIMRSRAVEQEVLDHLDEPTTR